MFWIGCWTSAALLPGPISKCKQDDLQDQGIILCQIDEHFGRSLPTAIAFIKEQDPSDFSLQNAFLCFSSIGSISEDRLNFMELAPQDCRTFILLQPLHPKMTEQGYFSCDNHSTLKVMDCPHDIDTLPFAKSILVIDPSCWPGRSCPFDKRFFSSDHHPW